MRLYLNDKEVPVIKAALQAQRNLYYKTDNPSGFEVCENLLHRISICEDLQVNERREDGTMLKEDYMEELVGLLADEETITRNWSSLLAFCAGYYGCITVEMVMAVREMEIRGLLNE